MGLVLSRKCGEGITLQLPMCKCGAEFLEDIVITVVEYRMPKVRLYFEAPQSIRIYRNEIWERIKQAEKVGLLLEGEEKQIDAIRDEIKRGE